MRLPIKTELVRIGNSRGIRIPKPIIEQCGFGDEVDLRVENERLVISPERLPRAGWEDRFRAACAAGEDELLLEPAANEFDRREWQW
ncbi:MAG: AbrB/MazE/SpoVT family DNA-binding domain-containing protein [Terriglobales bacterium]